MNRIHKNIFIICCISITFVIVLLCSILNVIDGKRIDSSIFSSNMSNKVFKLGSGEASSNGLLIRDLAYTGSSLGTLEVSDAFSNSSVLYGDDSSVNMTNLPYAYLNSEYLMLPRTDKTLTTDGLITFSITRNVDVMVLRDPAITTNPSWMAGYTDTNNTVTLSNGIVMHVYKKSYTYDSSNADNNIVVIGGNISSTATSESGEAQVVFVKETSKVQNRVFYSENFDDFDANKVLYAFDYHVDTTHTVSVGTIGGHTALHFEDSNSNISYFNEKFAPLSIPFAIEYSVYLDRTKTNDNRWIRMWLTSGIPETISDRSTLAIETYINGSNNATDTTSTITAIKPNGSNTTSETVGSSYPTSSWLKIRIEVNPSTKKYSIYTYDTDSSSWVIANKGTSVAANRDFFVTTLNQVDTFMFGSSATAKGDFYYDDISITPIMGIGATSIIVDGETITLNKDTSVYNVISLHNAEDAVVSLVKNDSEYYSHTITRSGNTLTVSITNLVNETYTFTINVSIPSLLETVTVVNPNSSSSVSVEDDYFNNSAVLHFTDNSSTDPIYIEKNFNSISTALEYSYDIYLKDKNSDNTVTYNNDSLLSYISNGTIGTDYNLTSATNIGVASYIRNMNSSYESFRFIQNGTTTDETSAISLNTWHNIKYEVNVSENKYKVYLDNVLVDDNFINFYNLSLNVNQLSNVVIGSNDSTISEFYVKNITVTESTDAPIDGITIGGYALPNFDKYNSTYDYYTDNSLPSASSVTITGNIFYASSVVIIDSTNNKVIIDVTDNIGGVQRYIVNYIPRINMNISKSQLLELINKVNALTSTDYTFNTWNILEDAKNEATTTYNDAYAIASEITYAYIKLSDAYDGLLVYELYDDSDEITITDGSASATYTDYEAALVDTIYYSNNLTSTDIAFNKVLENGSAVYNGTTYENFKWESVPYKYMNSEYMVLNNEIVSNSSFEFTALYDIDMLIFKDWDSGPVTNVEASNTLSSSEPDLVNTKEIAIASGSVNDENKKVIYYVYKKSYHRGDIIRVDGNTLINNDITGNNSIIAFIKTTNSNNENFFYEDINSYQGFTATLPNGETKTYSSLHLYNKNWTNIVSTIAIGTASGNTTTEIRTDNTTQYIYQESGDAYTMPIVQKKFAELYENVDFKFDAYTETASVANKWIRTWLTKFNQTSGIVGSASDKAKTLVDLYIGDDVMLLNEKNTQGNGQFGSIGSQIWNSFNIDYDIFNQTFTLKVNDVEQTFPFTYNNNTYSNNFYNSGTSALSSTNYVYFAGRGSNTSKARFKEIYVNPIPSGVYTNINVTTGSNTSTLGCGTNVSTCPASPSVYEKLYQDLTKAYLYKIVSSTDAPTITTTKNTGYTYSDEVITNNIDMTNYDYASISSGNVTINNQTYSRNYTVYYEVENNNAKEALVNLVDEANLLIENNYTAESWQPFKSKLLEAINILKNHKSNESDVNTLTTELTSAINDLELKSDILYNYVGKIDYGKKYDTITNTEEVNVTNNSSVSGEYILDARTSSSTYVYAGKVHYRYLVLDSVMPEGTKITFIDKTFTNPTYYTYTVSASDVTNSVKRFSLNNFIKSGTTDEYYDGSYSFNSETRIIYGYYAFILDFMDTVTPLSSGKHQFFIEHDVDGVVISKSDNLYFNAYTERNNITMELSTEKEFYTTSDTIIFEDSITIDPIVVNGKTITDTTLTDSLLGLKIQLYDLNNNLVNFSKGFYIKENGNTQYLDNDNVLRINSGYSFSTGNINFQFEVGSTVGIMIPGEYVGVSTIYASADGNNDNDARILSTASASVSIRKEANCSIRAVLIDEKNLLNPHLSNQIEMNIQTICNDCYNNADITVSLYKKNNNIFSDFGYTLIDYQSYVTDSITQRSTYGENIYKLTTIENSTSSRFTSDENYTIYFNDLLTSGTYRLVYDIRADGVVTQSDVLNFVVK